MLLRVSYVQYEIEYRAHARFISVYFSVIAAKMRIIVAGCLEVSREEIKCITHQ